MKQLFSLFAILILVGCNSSDRIEEGQETTPPESDSVSVWTYDYENEMPMKSKAIQAGSLTPEKWVDFVNNNIGDNNIHLDFVKVSKDTLYVRIKESTYLTQQMGTTGADDYMSTTTFTLTELKNIKYVNYDFEEGDHAMPGTYSRQYYIDRNKSNNLN